MPGLVPGIHVSTTGGKKTWMAGTRPAMTEEAGHCRTHDSPHRHTDRTDRDPDVVAFVRPDRCDRKDPGVPARRDDICDRRAGRLRQLPVPALRLQCA